MSRQLENVRQGALQSVSTVGKGGLSFLQEFKDFINKGNIIQIAVAFVVGTAFSVITKSFVDDMITPVIALAGNNSTFSEKFITLRSPAGRTYNTREEALKDGAVTMNWGTFVQSIINFIIVSFVMFLLVKVTQGMNKQPEEEPTMKCPYCVSKIDVASVKCKFCASVIPKSTLDSVLSMS